MPDMEPDSFYVPDEPVADVLAAYEAGIKGVTARPATQSATLRLTHVRKSAHVTSDVRPVWREPAAVVGEPTITHA